VKIYPFIFFGLVVHTRVRRQYDANAKHSSAKSCKTTSAPFYCGFIHAKTVKHRWQVVYLLHFMLLCLHRNVAAKNQKIASRTSGSSR
jgi:hypothetical protein